MSILSTNEEIKELIHQYKQHNCLWNIYSPSYKDRLLKQRAWSKIAHYFHKKPNDVKRKMQYLRSAYVHEKRRVDASKMSDTENIRKPLLFYYKEMDFLDSIVVWRKFENGKDISNLCSESVGSSQDFKKDFVAIQNSEDVQEPELNCKMETFDEFESNIFSPTEELAASTPFSCNETQAPTMGKRNGVEPNIFLSFTSSATKSQTKLLYYSFGKTIALQLQHLPQEDALLAMSEIQNIITMKSLEYIRNLKSSSADYQS